MLCCGVRVCVCVFATTFCIGVPADELAELDRVLGNRQQMAEAMFGQNQQQQQQQQQLAIENRTSPEMGADPNALRNRLRSLEEEEGRWHHHTTKARLDLDAVTAQVCLAVKCE